MEKFVFAGARDKPWQQCPTQVSGTKGELSQHHLLCVYFNEFSELIGLTTVSKPTQSRVYQSLKGIALSQHCDFGERKILSQLQLFNFCTSPAPVALSSLQL